MQIGRELVEWSKDNPLALTIPMFTANYDGLHSEILREWCTKSEEFYSMYKKAKENIGANRLRASQDKEAPIKISDAIYTKTLHYFDHDSKFDMRDEKIFDSKLRKEENKESSEDFNELKKNLSDQIKKQPQVTSCG
jgi:hypothetical protein